MQAALSECSRLRHLVLCQWKGTGGKIAWDRPSQNPERRKVDGCMIDMLSEKLPNLAVLELQMEGYIKLQAAESSMNWGPSPWQLATRPSSDHLARLHYDRGLISSIVQSDAAGLQLLQTECGIGHDKIDCTRLPPMLRFLSSPCRSEHETPCTSLVLISKTLGWDQA